jgi:hypothetical protein
MFIVRRYMVHILTFLMISGLLSLPLPGLADHYFVRQDAPDNKGVPNGDPSNPDDCWKTISQTFTDLKTDTGSTLQGKGEFIIQVQDTATYTESVTLDRLTTTANDTLTLRRAPGLTGRPTIDATFESGEAIKITTVAYVTIEGFVLKADQVGTQNEEIFPNTK